MEEEFFEALDALEKDPQEIHLECVLGEVTTPLTNFDTPTPKGSGILKTKSLVLKA